MALSILTIGLFQQHKAPRIFLWPSILSEPECYWSMCGIMPVLWSTALVHCTDYLCGMTRIISHKTCTVFYRKSGSFYFILLCTVMVKSKLFWVAVLELIRKYWSAAPHNHLAYLTGFWVCVVLVLNVIRCSCHYFLDRILFHNHLHYDNCDYHWDFYGY